MDDKKNKKKQAAMRAQNVLETLKNVGGGNPATKNLKKDFKDIGDSFKKSVKEDLIKQAPKDIINQMFGIAPRNYSGEISVGESIEMQEVFTGEHEEKKQLERRISFERRVRQEERGQIERKTNELRVQLQAIQKEVVTLTESTQDLAKETQLAAMQAPVEPGVYHVIFFEKLLEFIKSFRKKINEASTWLHSANKRAQKKNYWAKYKQHGSKFFLSGEHYLTRSAG
jgi:hypothetical protein